MAFFNKRPFARTPLRPAQDKQVAPQANKPLSNASGGKLRIISLGGVEVNRNMDIYETDKDIIIVDCGIGFPSDDMPGVDIVIPDITYLKDKMNKIRGIFLTHGHQDHWGSLPYILPHLPFMAPS